MDPREARVQRHILLRIQQALGDRSWNWLAEKSGVPQSTLASQSARPRFTIETLVRVSSVLNKPLVWFLPGAPTDQLEADGFRRIEALIDEVRAARGNT